MDQRLIWGAVVLLILLLLLGTMAVSWRARQRRDARAWPALPVPAGLAEPSIRLPGSFVAITRAEQPLQRITAAGLGFRGAAELRWHPEGLVLETAGAQPVFFSREAIRAAGRGSWAIDRAVEPGGLLVITADWGTEPVDIYLKPESVSEGARLIAALPQQGSAAAAQPDKGASL